MIKTALWGRGEVAAWMALALLAVWAVPFTVAAAGVNGLQADLSARASARDAVLVTAMDGRVVADVHGDRPLVPASILKLLTSLAAIDTLGETFRFTTEVYLTPENDLVIRGYGDPLLVSERVAEIAARVAAAVDRIGDLVMDGSYFAQPIRVPGRHRSAQPYDAPNGALCVNFNTVNFKQVNGRWVSAEPQTPMLPLARRKIKASGIREGRITLAGNDAEGTRYAGELFAYFLNRNGVRINGRIRSGRADQKDRLLLSYHSPHDLPAVISQLLEFSNNFIANQLVLTMGARRFGPPATLEKGTRVLQAFAAKNLKLTSAVIVEGSGISRDNRISARQMDVVLARFFDRRQLMRKDGRQYYKTGHLKGIRTRAGYIQGRSGAWYRFVVIRNRARQGTGPLMGRILSALR